MPQLVRKASDGRYETTLDESLMKTGWGKRKAAWLRSALIANQGGSRLDGPALSLHGRMTPLYPIAWVDGFLHPYTTNIW